MRLSQDQIGIISLVAGIAVFSLQDLILKLLSGDYPLHQAMLIRSLTAVPCLLLITRLMDGGLGGLVSPTWPAMLLRGLLNFVAYTLYYLALAALPMATTVALYFTAPIMIVVMSALILHEVVAPKRWMAVALGFAGVLLILRPGGDLFDWAAILPILCSLAYAGSMIMARVMGSRDSAAAMAFWGNLAFLACAAILSLIFGWGDEARGYHPSLAFLLRGWAWPGAWDLTLMASCGVIAALGLTLLTHAYRIGQSSTVAPFEFSFAFWGLLWGWLFWGDLPDGWGWLGIITIIAAGVYVLRSETAQPAKDKS